jgi:hypothetical protein
VYKGKQDRREWDLLERLDLRDQWERQDQLELLALVHKALQVQQASLGLQVYKAHLVQLALQASVKREPQEFRAQLVRQAYKGALV